MGIKDFIGSRSQVAHSEAHLASLSGGQGGEAVRAGTGGLRSTSAQARAMHTVRGSAFEISQETFKALEEYILWAESVPAKMPRAMDILSQIMSLTNMGIAQEMSYGAYDPQNRNPSQAWKIPVRRISQRYFYGWKVKHLGIGTWMLYNDSREAYFIEFGIHRNPQTEQVSSRRIRRPIRKLSLRRTLEATLRTNIYHRVWGEIFIDRKAHFGRGFSQTVQSPAGGHSMFAPYGAAAASAGFGGFGGPGVGRSLPG